MEGWKSGFPLSWTRDVTHRPRWEDDLKRWCAARDLETGFAEPDLVEATLRWRCEVQTFMSLIMIIIHSKSRCISFWRSRSVL